MRSYFTIFAALNGAFAVACGAFAAHGRDPVADAQRIGWLRTGAEYQMWHALALLGVLALAGPRFASWCFAIGIVFFSGSLYGLALTGQKWLGAIAPIGGLAFITGWLAWAWFLWRRKHE
jgi:uncharacterized membrane protein YgdD (TMEM256/DUF423 family)